MLDHVSITVERLSASAPFYEAIMTALEHPCVRRDEGVLGFGVRNDGSDDRHTYISIIDTGRPIQSDRRHWCFRAPDRLAVDTFHHAGLLNGGRNDGAPGLRCEYHPSYYAAFLLDPDGNRIEAVCHKTP